MNRCKRSRKQKVKAMTNDLVVKRQNELELCDTMLEQTSASAPKILCKKGVWSKGGEDIPSGSEFIAYPMDALRGACRWENDMPIEQRVGRIADKFPAFNKADFPDDEDWKPQIAMALEDPLTGEVFTFVSASVGGKIAVEKLINQTASGVKRGSGDLTPLVRLAASSFPSEQFGTITRPSFEIVPRQSVTKELNDEVPF
jgi:hypothetical protein